MFAKINSFQYLILIEIMTVALAGTAVPVAAAATLVDCSKGKELQKEIDNVMDGATIEIMGICMTNVLIKDKAVTLIGHSSPGPHGITGVAANTDGVHIENSRGTRLEDLTINNPFYTGVRMRGRSDVVMEDVEVSNSFSGGATGIWVQEGSLFNGYRVRLDDNLRGLGAIQQSRAFCYECSLNGNTRWAASSLQNSVVSLLDSVVAGKNGIQAQEFSYIDIDCDSHVSTHPCSLNASQNAGQAFWESTVVFGAGDFYGQVTAADRSLAHLLGARQLSTGVISDTNSNPRSNGISNNSSLRVEPYGDGVNPGLNSRLMGATNVHGFSNALIHGTGAELDGSLTCVAGGDAWVEPGVDLTLFTINGCAHAPPPP